MISQEEQRKQWRANTVKYRATHKDRIRESKRLRRLKLREQRGPKRLSVEHKANIGKAAAGANHPLWKGGRIYDQNGYVYIFQPNHPHANAGRYVYEHRLVMEAHIGRVLLSSEIVHHVNGIVSDNRIENLMLFSSHSEHKKAHIKATRGK